MADVASDDRDEDVIRAAASGDADAFDTLVRRYERRIVSFARTLVGPDDAEDLAQEVFIRVFRSLAGFRGESSFRTWLYTVTLNVARTHRSRQALRRAVWEDGGDTDSATDAATDGPSFESTLLARDAIARALEGLSEDLRVAVTLRDIHGLDYREIADATGAPLGTVESRIFRARQRLRTALAPMRNR